MSKILLSKRKLLISNGKFLTIKEGIFAQVSVLWEKVSGIKIKDFRLAFDRYSNQYALGKGYPYPFIMIGSSFSGKGMKVILSLEEIEKNVVRAYEDFLHYQKAEPEQDLKDFEFFDKQDMISYSWHPYWTTNCHAALLKFKHGGKIYELIPIKPFETDKLNGARQGMCGREWAISFYHKYVGYWTDTGSPHYWHIVRVLYALREVK